MRSFSPGAVATIALWKSARLWGETESETGREGERERINSDDADKQLLCGSLQPHAASIGRRSE